MSPSRPKPPEFVLDTDIVVAGVAAFGRRSPSVSQEEPIEAQILRHWLAGEWRWVTSEYLLREHEEILQRRGAPEARVRRVIARIRAGARIVKPRHVKERLPDPEDAPVIGTARAAGASLVTRNEEHYPLGIVKVLTAAQMLEEIGRYLRHPMVRSRTAMREISARSESNRKGQRRS